LLLVAERAGAVVGLASAAPVPARGRLFIEHFVRAPDAPNGTVELLVDGVMQRARAPEVTLGLAPLTGAVSRWLRLARWLGKPLYDFAGLRAFKAKLRPDTWEPVYLCVAHDASTLVALRDALRAFAGGSLVGFGAASLLGRR
jgi:phosphatidylglycerol lysyltransferase